MDKTTRNILIVMLLIAICWAFSIPKFMRYLIMGDKDIVISPPTGFYFSIAGEDGGDVYDLFESNYTDEHPYYITVKEEYLNNDNLKELYVTGQYRNCPVKPTVKVNGEKIDDIFIENTGYADGLFSNNYYSKLYHASIYDTIEEDKEYTFYVRAGDVSDSVKVVFTTRYTDDGELYDEEDEGW